ncbi:MAG: hypothetical protein NZ932_03920 [Candidatus Bathyarchaeota archaeon]|nr:hypothetical protein [Candidatus Bathyarchaeota archaeon]MDW8022385.1 hypothetical protein [Nitrososphaerota archaeon]
MSKCKCACEAIVAMRELIDLSEHIGRLVVLTPTSDKQWQSDLAVFEANAKAAISHLKETAKACNVNFDSLIQKIEDAKNDVRQRKVHHAKDKVSDVLSKFHSSICEGV